MALLQHIWIAMLTRNVEDAGTDSTITLVITEGTTIKLRHTFPDTVQEDQERGKANLYSINVIGKNIRSESINRGMQISINGSDLWQPEDFMVWGQAVETGVVIPLALATNLRSNLSTDPSEGSRTLSIRRIIQDSAETVLRQLLVLYTTADITDAGSSSALEIELRFAGGQRIWRQEIGLLRERGEAKYVQPPVFGFVGEPQPRRSNLDSIVLRIFGDDAWLPQSFFVFAFPSGLQGPRPEFVMPLVHIPSWTRGALSTDSSEGRRSISLPIARTALDL